jgi:hypothetical protein
LDTTLVDVGLGYVPRGSVVPVEVEFDIVGGCRVGYSVDEFWTVGAYRVSVVVNAKEGVGFVIANDGLV